VGVVSVVCTKNVPVLITKAREKYHTKLSIKCEECSVDQGSPLWLCHPTKKINGKHTVVSCHLRYHLEKKFIATDSTESSVISDLTED
jgi:hypothetical protein